MAGSCRKSTEQLNPRAPRPPDQRSARNPAGYNPEMTSWAAIDFETASSLPGSACALGVALVDDGLVVETRKWMIRPQQLWFDPFCVAVHGITADDVRDEPEWPEIWPNVEAYVADRTMVAHNAGFDMGVLRAACQGYGLRAPVGRYFCTRLVGRRAWPGKQSYRLNALAREFGIDLLHHEPESDARACAEIAIRACRDHAAASIEELGARLHFRVGEMTEHGFDRCTVLQPSGPTSSKDMAPTTNHVDPAHPLHGKRFVLTGELTDMQRADAMQLVVNVGGRVTGGVSGKTDYVVAGAYDTTMLDHGVRNAKLAKAQQLRADGGHVVIVRDGEFLGLLGSR